MPTLPAVAGGARPVFRPECGPEGPGRSVELLLIDAVAPLDFAVLLRAPGPNVPMPDPSGFDPQDEGE